MIYLQKVVLRAKRRLEKSRFGAESGLKKSWYGAIGLCISLILRALSWISKSVNILEFQKWPKKWLKKWPKKSEIPNLWSATMEKKCWISYQMWGKKGRLGKVSGDFAEKVTEINAAKTLR